MNKLSMLVALMCIIFIPVMSMQAPTVTGDDLKGEWIDEETNNIIEATFNIFKKFFCWAFYIITTNS